MKKVEFSILGGRVGSVGNLFGGPVGCGGGGKKGVVGVTTGGIIGGLFGVTGVKIMMGGRGVVGGGGGWQIPSTILLGSKHGGSASEIAE